MSSFEEPDERKTDTDDTNKDFDRFVVSKYICDGFYLQVTKGISNNYKAISQILYLEKLYIISPSNCSDDK